MIVDFWEIIARPDFLLHVFCGNVSHFPLDHARERERKNCRAASYDPKNCSVKKMKELLLEEKKISRKVR